MPLFVFSFGLACTTHYKQAKSSSLIQLQQLLKDISEKVFNKQPNFYRFLFVCFFFFRSTFAQITAIHFQAVAMETDCRLFSTASGKNQKACERDATHLSGQIYKYVDGVTIFMGTRHDGYINFC